MTTHQNLAAAAGGLSDAIVGPGARIAGNSVALVVGAEGVLGAGARLEHGASLELGSWGGDGEAEDEGNGGDGELHVH